MQKRFFSSACTPNPAPTDYHENWRVRMGFSSLPRRRLMVVTRIAVPLIAFAAVSVLSTASAYAGDNVISQASNQCLGADANHNCR